MKSTIEIEITRPDHEIAAVIRGWSDTHVLFDAWDVTERRWRNNLCRPILPFMLDYELFGEGRSAMLRAA
jgi:hypothetical protein